MLDRRDHVLISHLRTDARAPLLALSRATGIPCSSLHDRYKALAPLLRHATLIDFAALGHPVQKVFAVAGAQPRVLRRAAHPCVNNALRTPQGALLEAVFPDLKAAEAFRHTLRGLATEEHDVLEELKREAFTSLPGA